MNSLLSLMFLFSLPKQHIFNPHTYQPTTVLKNIVTVLHCKPFLLGINKPPKKLNFTDVYGYIALNIFCMYLMSMEFLCNFLNVCVCFNRQTSFWQCCVMWFRLILKFASFSCPLLLIPACSVNISSVAPSLKFMGGLTQFKVNVWGWCWKMNIFCASGEHN